MSPMIFIASGIVILSCVALVVAGTAFRWDLTSRAYAISVRAIGVFTVVALAAVAAWSRRAEPSVAAAILVGGVALSAAYVWTHRRLSAHASDLIGTPSDRGGPSE